MLCGAFKLTESSDENLLSRVNKIGVESRIYIKSVLNGLPAKLIDDTQMQLIAVFKEDLGVLVYPGQGRIKVNVSGYEIKSQDESAITFVDTKGNLVTLYKTNYYSHE